LPSALTRFGRHFWLSAVFLAEFEMDVFDILGGGNAQKIEHCRLRTHGENLLPR